MWLLRRSLWVQQVNMMFVSGLLSYQPVWMSFFSRGGLKQSLWTGSVHFLRRPTVITWLSVPCVRDAISLICLFLSQERRGGDLCRSVSPLLRSEIRRESYCLCCTVIYSHSCCKQPLPLSSPSHCVQTARWVSCHGNGMLHLFHLQTFGVFSGQYVWANTLSTLSNLTPNKRKYQPFLCKRYYSGWKTADHPLISSSYVSDGSTGTVNMCDIIRKCIKYKLNSSAKKSFPCKVISLICRM